MNILKNTLIVTAAVMLAHLGTAQAEAPASVPAQATQMSDGITAPTLIAGRDGLDRMRDFYDTFEERRTCIG